MTNRERNHAKARELARQVSSTDGAPIAFELRFEKGYEETREWLHDAAVLG
jgi:hypothetical protein